MRGVRGFTKEWGQKAELESEVGAGLQNLVYKNTGSAFMCHPHAHSLPIASSSGVPPCASGRGFSSFGFRGAPGWARGRASARLSSSWCCPECGLCVYEDGALCVTCDTMGAG